MRFAVAAEVAAALADGTGVVALETTLISHGMPRPDNAVLAREIEAAVRHAGAIPATTAVLDGAVRVGLGPDALERMAASPGATKCSTRDLPLALAGGQTGATTVAATAFIAARAGIEVMATGGIGGVHRGGEDTLDVSADLEEIARRPVLVVCSGAKSILDLGRTLERLESLGVPVVGFGCDQLPGFYCAETGLPVPRVDDLDTLMDVVEAHFALGLPGGLIVAQPPPAAVAMPRAEVDHLVQQALAAVETAGIRGPAATPFMLRAMAEQSRGRTVMINRKLVLANAALAARIAVGRAMRRALEKTT